jgi:hypothetical protein
VPVRIEFFQSGWRGQTDSSPSAAPPDLPSRKRSRVLAGHFFNGVGTKMTGMPNFFAVARVREYLALALHVELASGCP